MILAFFQSIKYVGHIVPLALFRIYFGYLILIKAIERSGNGFLEQPRLAAMVTEWLPLSSAPQWYKTLAEPMIVDQWQFFAWLVVFIEAVVGVSYILGFFVRPASLLGLLLALNMLFIVEPQEAETYQILVGLFLCMGWIGAGRCFGLDYYFFKRTRGLWW
jgi:thiosulfate dehydrogenase [quinone] large subunit